MPNELFFLFAFCKMDKVHRVLSWKHFCFDFLSHFSFPSFSVHNSFYFHVFRHYFPGYLLLILVTILFRFKWVFDDYWYFRSPSNKFTFFISTFFIIKLVVGGIMTSGSANSSRRKKRTLPFGSWLSRDVWEIFNKRIRHSDYVVKN